MLRPRALIGVATVGIAATVALGGTSVATQTDARTVAPHRLARSLPEATASSPHQRIVEYWTPQRRTRALNANQLAPVVKRDSAAAVAAARPVSHPGSAAANLGVPFIGGQWTGQGRISSTAGKVFFTKQGFDYVCTGDVINSPNKDLIVTAGHCVNEGPGLYVKNFAFVPGPVASSTPYGTFTARSLATTSQWKSHGDFNYDVGMAVLRPLAGLHVADAVGAQGVAFNQPRGQFLHAFGYAASAPYDGRFLDYCSDNATVDQRGGNNERLLCNLTTRGAGGGPWLQGFDQTTGAGTQVSVSSFKYFSDPAAMLGPYFGTAVQKLYDRTSVL